MVDIISSLPLAISAVIFRFRNFPSDYNVLVSTMRSMWQRKCSTIV